MHFDDVLDDVVFQIMCFRAKTHVPHMAYFWQFVNVYDAAFHSKTKQRERFDPKTIWNFLFNDNVQPIYLSTL